MNAVSRSDFEVAVECFLGELTMIAHRRGGAGESEALAENIKEALALLRDPNLQHAEVIALACGLVDEYSESVWDELVERSYAFFLDRMGANARATAEIENHAKKESSG